MDDKPKRWWQRGRRATFLEWCTLVAILSVAFVLVCTLIWQDWSTRGIPEWYQAYLRWQKRHGIDWIPF